MLFLGLTLKGTHCVTEYHTNEWFCNRQSGLHLLKRALSGNRYYNLRAVMEIHRGPDDIRKVVILQSENGYEKNTSYDSQGNVDFEMLDSLDSRSMYLVKKHVLRIGDSPRGKESVDFRINLIKKNYQISTENASLVGQNVVVVIASPHVKELQTYRLFIEPRSAYILELELQDPHGQPKIEYNTTSITFPHHINRSEFSIKVDNQVQTEHFEAPRSIIGPSEARKILNGAPFWPKHCPMGFQMERSFKSEDHGVPIVATRYTDGFAHITVVEMAYKMKGKYLAGNRGRKLHPGFQAGNIWIQVFSRLPNQTESHFNRLFLESMK